MWKQLTNLKTIKKVRKKIIIGIAFKRKLRIEAKTGKLSLHSTEKMRRKERQKSHSSENGGPVLPLQKRKKRLSGNETQRDSQIMLILDE